MKAPIKDRLPNTQKSGPPARLTLSRTEIDRYTNSHMCIVGFPTTNGRGEVRVPRSQLLTPRDLERTIVDHGGAGPIDFASEGLRLLDATAPEVYVVKEAEWCGGRLINRYGENGDVGPDEHDTRFDRTAVAWAGTDRAGSLKKYLEGLDLPISHSPFLMMALGAALVPSLSMRLGTPASFSIAMTGGSTAGKTRAAMLAQSVSTRAVEESDLTSLNMTMGVAGELGQYSGSVIAYKDPKGSQVKGRALAELLQTIIFGVSGGDTRQRLGSAPGAARRTAVDAREKRDLRRCFF